MVCRDVYLDHIVLGLYKSLNFIEFPIEPEIFSRHYTHIRFLSYSRLSKQSGEPVEKIIETFNSRAGCSNYDPNAERFLCMYNDDPTEMTPGRIRWTKAHELAHALCGHLQLLHYREEGHTISEELYKKLENECNVFAGKLLAPYCAFKLLAVKSPLDVEKTFGLSSEASLIHFKQYLKWKKGLMNAEERQLQKEISDKLINKERRRIKI